MTDSIILFTNPMSRGRIVRWMMEECGADYETHVLHFGAELRDAAYLAVNPMGKVPALKIGNTVVTETAACVATLADLFPEKQLAPAPGDPERGEYFRALFFTAASLEYAVVNSFLKYAADTADAEKMLGYGSLQRALDTTESLLKGKTFAVGDRFSAADVLLTSTLAWAMYKIHVIPENTIFQNYIVRHMQRDAFKRAAAADDALLELES